MGGEVRKTPLRLWPLGAIGLTYVEQVAVGPGHPAFWPLFVSVFVLNTAFAIDAYQEAHALFVDPPPIQQTAFVTEELLDIANREVNPTAVA